MRHGNPPDFTVALMSMSDIGRYLGYDPNSVARHMKRYGLDKKSI